MAYSRKLADRIRRILSNRRGVTEQKMFGGVAFMIRGHMACGPMGDDLIIRIGAEAAARTIKLKHVKPMDFTGKVLKPFALIQAAGLRSDTQLRRWVAMAADFAAGLPAKSPSPRSRKSTSISPPRTRANKKGDPPLSTRRVSRRS